jgi:hypothetical protein
VRSQQRKVELDRRHGAIEAQRRTEHAPVLGRVRRPRPAEPRCVQRDTPARQPAQHAQQHHQQRFVGEAPRRRRGDAVGQFQRRHGAVLAQREPHVVKEEVEAAHRFAKRATDTAVAEQRPAQQREAADLHAPRIQPEELVVELARHSQPERTERISGDSRLRVRQHIGWHPAGRQHAAARDGRQPHHGAGDEGAGHRRHGGRGMGGGGAGDGHGRFWQSRSGG